MDKKTLVIQKELSTDMEFSGDFLLKELTKKHIKIDAAMWFFYAEINDWKYILVFDEFSQKGSSFVYEAISDINRKALSKRYKRIPLNYIEVKSNTSFIYKDIVNINSFDKTVYYWKSKYALNRTIISLQIN